jgi:glycosyltransferase involved in cell wall biosynthesis
VNKHILVVAQYFYPEQFRINDICEEWVKRGYKVTVLTGIPNYPQGKYYKGYGLFRKRRENHKGIDIRRIPLVPRGKSSFMLILNYLSFVISGFFFSKLTRLHADHVFIYEVSPMTQALPGIWFARRRNIPCTLYVTDLWPENVEIAGGIRNNYVLHLIGKMVDYIYRNCDLILTSSRSFVEKIAERSVCKQKLEYWPHYAEDFYKQMPKASAKDNLIPQDGRFNILFAGNIGFAQGLEILPETAQILKQRRCNSVRFNLVGDGRAKANLIEQVKRNDVEEFFNFVEKQPATRIPFLMSACDTALICLTRSTVFELTLPSKTQSCLACGTPIIVSADGEICSVIKEAGAGLCSPAGDPEELASIILEMSNLPKEKLHEMGRRALDYYEKNFDKNRLLDRMDDLLRQQKGDFTHV